MLKMILGFCLVAFPMVLTSCGQNNTASKEFNINTASRGEIEAELARKGVSIHWYADGDFRSSIPKELRSQALKEEILKLIGSYKAAIYRDAHTSDYSALSRKDQYTINAMGRLTELVATASVAKSN